MKQMKVKYKELIEEQRWDIDYHLPPIEIRKYNETLLTEMCNCADIIADKRNPTLEPEKPFIYIDISSIDVITGMILNPQDLVGEEAPSRARKVVRSGDIIISTCRPTRGAISIIPPELDNQICSTGFSVIRAKEGINNRYLHFILRSALVKEQFRKFSTGSSYPAILDSDVEKTIIPLPDSTVQKQIADKVDKETQQRNQIIEKANAAWEASLSKCLSEIQEVG